MPDESELLADYEPKLYDIHRHFENYMVENQLKSVVGNDEVRLLSTLMFAIRKIPIIIKGPAGTGKTTIIKSTASLIWGDDVFSGKVKEVLYLADTSDKGMVTDALANRIANVCSHCIIPELQNAISNERVEAIIKLWTERESYLYQRAGRGGRITEEIVLKPLPIFTSIATENKYTEKLGEEMERRLFPFYTLANRDLNEEVHKSKAVARMRCEEDVITMSEAERTNLRFHIQDAMKLGTKYKNPSAGFIQKAIPKNYSISNSMIEYWFELVSSITAFFHTERIKYTKPGGSEYVLSTPADNFIAWRLGGPAVVMASLNIPDMGREIIEFLPTRDKDDPGARKTVNEIIDDLQTSGYERSKKQVNQVLRMLESANYARRDENTKDGYYRTQDYTSAFDTHVDWKTCVEETRKAVKEYQPEVADEYIEKFCTDPKFEEPFTGATAALLDVPYESKAPPKAAGANRN